MKEKRKGDREKEAEIEKKRGRKTDIWGYEAMVKKLKKRERKGHREKEAEIDRKRGRKTRDMEVWNALWTCEEIRELEKERDRMRSWKMEKEMQRGQEKWREGEILENTWTSNPFTTSPAWCDRNIYWDHNFHFHYWK